MVPNFGEMLSDSEVSQTYQVMSTVHILGPRCALKYTRFIINMCIFIVIDRYIDTQESVEVVRPSLKQRLRSFRTRFCRFPSSQIQPEAIRPRRSMNYSPPPYHYEYPSDGSESLESEPNTLLQPPFARTASTSVHIVESSDIERAELL
jgi:hypothetical protein